MLTLFSPESRPPLLPDVRGWTRLAYRMRSSIGARRMLRLGRTLRANFMEAEPEAVEAMRSTTRYRGGYVLKPSTAASTSRRVGLLFFPGALVHEAAYAPILQSVADASGATVVCVRMPVRHPLAVQRFRLRKLRQRVERQSRIDAWVVGGHSMGAGRFGAAGYASRQHAALEGARDTMCTPLSRVLLAPRSLNGLLLAPSGSRPRAPTSTPATASPRLEGLVMWAGALDGRTDLSGAHGLRCLAVFGTRDTVVPPAGRSGGGVRVRETRRLLPRRSRWLELRGANHAGFGHYGRQSFPLADGELRISRERQQARVVESTARLLREVASASS